MRRSTEYDVGAEISGSPVHICNVVVEFDDDGLFTGLPIRPSRRAHNGCAMAYDVELADRIRAALTEQPSVVEKKMFGGLQFMVAGKLTVGATVDGELLIKCDPARTEELETRPGAQRAAMRGRTMSNGWITVTSDGCAGDDLTFWIGVALDFRRQK